MKLSLLHRHVLTGQGGQMLGWPSLVSVGNGHLIAVASERPAHISPDGRLVLTESMDAGRSWAPLRSIFDSPLDDRHPSLFRAGQTLCCAFLSSAYWMDEDYFREEWRSRAEALPANLVETLDGDWIVRSQDQGQSWGKASRLRPGGALRTNPFPMSRQRLGCFWYQTTSESKVELAFGYSEDVGETWIPVGMLVHPDRTKIERPFAPWSMTRGGRLDAPNLSMRDCLELSPGHLLALFSKKSLALNMKEPLLATRSRDAGCTWSALTPVSLDADVLYGYSPQILKLGSGLLLLVYTARFTPWGIRAAYSTDEGLHWRTFPGSSLAVFPDNLDLGFPTVSESEPGVVTLLFYVFRAAELPSARNGLHCHRLQVSG